MDFLLRAVPWLAEKAKLAARRGRKATDLPTCWIIETAGLPEKKGNPAVFFRQGYEFALACVLGRLGFNLDGRWKNYRKIVLLSCVDIGLLGQSNGRWVKIRSDTSNDFLVQ